MFRRVQNKAEFEIQTERHMVLFNAFKLLEFTFIRGLKRNVDLKYKWADNAVIIPNIHKK